MNLFIKMGAPARQNVLIAKMRRENIGARTVLEGGYFVIAAWLRSMNSIRCIGSR
jgi:hypothetical protein